ncbi:Abi-alpha family protein [Bradyrhizobium sp. SZCCHNS2015]|uniref:Abi-alpha family protein n=1 Tax=Bradyrhizobium sp. SZCCHNS2015 TaxID=3057305 RepID=UPI0028F07C6F|nr:Abi-alpha family protein [Bradyrhizobium sp. SZCCHNS2015]
MADDSNKGSLVSALIGSTGITDEQAKAVRSISDFGTTVVTESSKLVQYVGRVLGTVPHDVVGLVIGDPLSFVRTAIAGQYDILLSKIFERRRVTKTQPVSPSLAIPLLRAAYDESRPELQALWASLIASAMDPNRSARVRLSFIETLRRFDPLDAVVLRARHQASGELKPNPVAFIASQIGEPPTEVHISVDNLKFLNCAASATTQVTEFYVTNYGAALLRACSD